MGAGQVVALCAGAFCLGVAMVVALVFAAAARTSEDQSEGCLGKFFAAGVILLAAFFFLVALMP